MQFFAIAALVATAAALPALEVRGSDACPTDGLYTNPLCCSTDVLDVASLDCKVPSESFSGPRSFRRVCAKQGQKAQCCAVPVAGQALLCMDVIGA
ncbi:hydrophobin [Drechmeria coniospora]|uniref:Hydrophobin n=1 Tax=Drechmeria coniospora TaxID=98403 RepID=A0A151GJ00_DRECN|nr:hydrophobin [Drechmeria coniospora]KYK57080.1 hydrophobin [Drechmeria coniospora]ODA78982.1 hypothetical protein RJ55_04572 [Drechmeria coniospora]